MKQKLRHIVVILGLVVMFAAFVASYFVASPHTYEDANKIVPSKTSVEITHKTEQAFVTSADVLSLLNLSTKDTVLQTVDTRKLEKDLIEKSPYIKSAIAYIAPQSHSLQIELEERQPMMALFYSDKASYIDTDGIIFPNRRGAAYVPVVTGNITEKMAQTYLLDLANYLTKHKRWRQFFGSIHVVSEKEVYLYPRVGDFVFCISPKIDFDEQFDKVEIFYEKILPRTGVEKYTIVNLSYRNQIVCKRRS
ncbi:MAG: hypothetical protein Q3998_04720 [Porphyromonas sp.]|nr:hypothetical protein [Porphyromonas sp.]